MEGQEQWLKWWGGGVADGWRDAATRNYYHIMFYITASAVSSLLHGVLEPTLYCDHNRTLRAFSLLQEYTHG